jgi:DNA invertase Pin-like site-specific DNA recombinase
MVLPTLEAIMKRVGIYIRISTDGQTTANQRRELEAAARSGWEIVGFYEDAGISGTKGRDKRPGFDRLLKDAPRGRSTWLPLGRSIGSAAACNTLSDF